MAQLAFYVVKFLITFCILVAMNANIERLRSGTLDLPRPFSPTQVSPFSAQIRHSAPLPNYVSTFCAPCVPMLDFLRPFMCPNIERLRSGTLDLPRPFSPTQVSPLSAQIRLSAPLVHPYSTVCAPSLPIFDFLRPLIAQIRLFAPLVCPDSTFRAPGLPRFDFLRIRQTLEHWCGIGAIGLVDTFPQRLPLVTQRRLQGHLAHKKQRAPGTLQ